MGFTENLKNEVLNGYLPNEDDAMALAGEDTDVIAELPTR